ncbi:GNAT family N-acetyltransferase [Roseimaritima sediminicola]|uniref:N-acetyltransferase n=1 Tax=Roseimaritima sediminicola TaxID=2662066 RepID=UPI0012982703|nr:N-acetyltransferase [Roseimaritima sediminicola]
MSEALRCWPVSTGADRRAFMRVLKDLYRDDPLWVPPIWSHQKEVVGFKKHPFWDDADGQAFLVARDNRVIGRVLALVNHAHNRRYDERRGFFGFFECADDPEAAKLLLDTACEWLKTQGMTAVRGPTSPSLNYECGTLIDGFDTPPTFMIPYNPPYHDALIQGAGFEKREDLYSYDAHVSILQKLDPKLLFILEEVKRRFDVNCRPLDKKNLARDVRIFLEIYNRSLEGTWGYVPMSDAEIDHQAKGLKHLLVPEVTSLAEVDGKPVGAGFGLLDFNPIIKKINGRLFPFGWIRLFTDRKKLKRVRLVSTNVLPEYQKWGLGLVTLERIVPDALEFGIEIGEFSWVLESNSLSRRTIERGGADKTKTHRLYDRELVDG